MKLFYDAVKGGWEFDKSIANEGNTEWLLNGDDMATKALALLDPKFWQAVGRVRGWHESYSYDESSSDKIGWGDHWNKFIENLATGIPLKDAIKSVK